MATPRRKQIKAAIAALESLKDAVGDEQQAVVASVVALLASLDSEIAELSERLQWHAQAPYRKKSENVPPGQLAFELIEMLKGRLDESEDSDEKAGKQGSSRARPKKKKKRKRRGRNLQRRVVECRIEDAQELRCPCCEEPRTEIGFDAQERFVYQPAEVYILEERRYKYACRRCAEGVATADAHLRPKPIPGSMASCSLLAHIVVSKVLDGLPVERVAKQLRRHGADLAPSTLNDWFGQTARMFTLLHSRFRKRLLASSLISLDDTPLRAQSRGHPRNIRAGRQWLYLGDVDQVAYAEFSADWKGIHPRRVLEGFAGDIQNDGYAGINPLFVGDGAPKRVGCNDHCRRKFVQALERGDKRAQPVVDLYRAIYMVERTAAQRGLDPAGRAALRRAESVPLWDQLREEIAQLEPRVENKSPLGRAIVYWKRQQPYLRAFLNNGRLPISNAHVERLIRLVAIFRKNSLFVGSIEAGERYAVLLTIMLNCVLAGANPYEYLVDVIDKVANVDWPSDRIDELMPRAWLAARSEQQAPGDAVVAGVS